MSEFIVWLQGIRIRGGYVKRGYFGIYGFVYAVSEGYDGVLSDLMDRIEDDAGAIKELNDMWGRGDVSIGYGSNPIKAMIDLMDELRGIYEGGRWEK